MTRKWKISYACRTSEGEYEERDIFVLAGEIATAVKVANELLDAQKVIENWKKFCVWDVGVMCEADEEMC